jgi:hypothetical protein
MCNEQFIFNDGQLKYGEDILTADLMMLPSLTGVVDPQASPCAICMHPSTDICMDPLRPILGEENLNRSSVLSLRSPPAVNHWIDRISSKYLAGGSVFITGSHPRKGRNERSPNMYRPSSYLLALLLSLAKGQAIWHPF